MALSSMQVSSYHCSNDATGSVSVSTGVAIRDIDHGISTVITIVRVAVTVNGQAVSFPSTGSSHTTGNVAITRDSDWTWRHGVSMSADHFLVNAPSGTVKVFVVDVQWSNRPYHHNVRVRPLEQPFNMAAYVPSACATETGQPSNIPRGTAAPTCFFPPAIPALVSIYLFRYPVCVQRIECKVQPNGVQVYVARNLFGFLYRFYEVCTCRYQIYP